MDAGGWGVANFRSYKALDYISFHFLVPGSNLSVLVARRPLDGLGENVGLPDGGVDSQVSFLLIGSHFLLQILNFLSLCVDAVSESPISALQIL